MSANPTRNDLESQKFGLSTLGDVFVDIEVVTQDPLAVFENPTVNDLEVEKFTPANKLRVVLTV